MRSTHSLTPPSEAMGGSGSPANVASSSTGRKPRMPEILQALARQGIFIGLPIHALEAVHTWMSRGVKKASASKASASTAASSKIAAVAPIAAYASLFRVLEIDVTLPDLPSEELMRHVLQQPSLRVLWHVTIPEIAHEHTFFDRQEWGAFVGNIQEHAAGRHTIVLALDRTMEYTPERFERLLSIHESIYPLESALEFEHSSWKKSEATLVRMQTPRVELDAPRLPGIVKKISAENRRAAFYRLVGRNARTWFEQRPSERFVYDYANDLESVVARIQELHEVAGSVSVIFAHYPAETALENALSAAAMLQTAMF